MVIGRSKEEKKELVKSLIKENKDRFIRFPAGGGILTIDSETGIEYFSVEVGYGGSLTPLLDREGKPLINKRFK